MRVIDNLGVYQLNRFLGKLSYFDFIGNFVGCPVN